MIEQVCVCDKCGKKYTMPNYCDPNYDKNSSGNTVFLSEINCKSIGDVGCYMRFDLCNICSKDLWKWLNNGKGRGSQ